MLLLIDNSPVSFTDVGVAKAANRGFDLLPYPSYERDLAPSDFLPVFNLKFHLGCRHLGNNDQII